MEANIPYILLGMLMFAVGWVIAWRLNCYESYYEGYTAAMRDVTPKPSQLSMVAPEETRLLETQRFRYRGRTDSNRAYEEPQKQAG